MLWRNYVRKGVCREEGREVCKGGRKEVLRREVIKDIKKEGRKKKETSA